MKRGGYLLVGGPPVIVQDQIKKILLNASSFKRNRRSQAFSSSKLSEPAECNSSIAETSRERAMNEMLAIEKLRLSTPLDDFLQRNKI